MYRDNVNRPGSDPRGSFAKRLFGRFVKCMEWFHFRSTGKLFREDMGGIWQGRPRFKNLSGIAEVDLSEEQRLDAAEEQRRKPRIG